MSVRHAFEEYGVVIDAQMLRVDSEATRRERERRRRTG
jgi:hypothetical protein